MDEYAQAIKAAADTLRQRLPSLENANDVLKAPELKSLYQQIPKAPPERRPELGKQINELRQELESLATAAVDGAGADTVSIDPTAPFDVNIAAAARPALLPLPQGSGHPLIEELEYALAIFRSMGFETHEARQLDDDYNMFGALNFPEGHPARDNWDTFMTSEGLLPIAHTTSYDHRLLKMHRPPVAALSYGRCFRNEDVDATHEHTFYQIDGILVAEKITLGDLLGTFKVFFEQFFGEKLQIRTQPAFFPFVEPGLEYLISKPASLGGKPGEWLEVMGCGMVHPNVLLAADLDPKKYSGFAWGFGLDRLVMLKYGIEDMRHLHSGRLEFLRKFK